jgi:putative ABC transport system permease protein
MKLKISRMKLRNSFLLSIRHLKAEKINTLINIAGLTLGLGIVSIVIVYVLNEAGYNSSFKNREYIYRILNYNSAENSTWANTPYILGETITAGFAEAEKCVRVYNISNIEIKKENDFIHEPGMICAGSSFFDIFGINLLQGSLSGFDQTDNKVLVSSGLSHKYFGNDNPSGKLITLRYLGNEHPMEIIGVFETLPQNSTLKASIIAGSDFGMHHLMASLVTTSDTKPDERQLKESWENGLFFTNYILLKPGTSIVEFEKKLHQLGVEHSKDNSRMSLSLQSLSDIYFGSGKIVDNNSEERGNITMVYVLIFIGMLILTIACINYLNLTSAQALNQSRSLAVRKICGASRGSLILQMILESSLVSIIALPLALQFAQSALPFVSQLLGKSYLLTFSYRSFFSIGILAIITLSTGALSGFLVSLRITSFGLVETIKGRNGGMGKKNYLRKAMVVFQISVFIILIAVMLLVQKQVDFAFSKDLGFAKEGLVRVPVGDHNYELFKQEIRKNAAVLDVSGALWLPPHQNKMNITIPKVDEPAQMVNVNGIFVDYHFARTMGLKLIKGSDFDETKNNSGVLVNESAIKSLGLKDIIGEQIAFGTIIGVVSDFNMYSIHEAINPMIIGLNPSMVREIAIRINTENIKQTIGFLKDSWESTGGTTPFHFELTDDVMKRLYESDIRFSKTIGLMAIFAIFIASLGLFGLSLLISKQKTKEIGIRKINGSGVAEVMIMLNRDFLLWVIMSFVIACPIAWYAGRRWLGNFAYRTELSWWIFALAGLMALTIAVFTVSWHSWRAARRNPVEALKYE